MSIFSSLNYLLTKAVSAINQTFTESPQEVFFNENNGTNLIVQSINTSTAYLEIKGTPRSKNDVQFPKETHPNAEHLLESWWNIFDARYLRHGYGLTFTLIMAYMIMLVVGVIGNVMVILVVLLRPQMRSVTNMFIMNLAVADLFVIVFCVPSTLLANIVAPWILGSFMCKAVAYVQGVAVCASAYSLAAISLDRCQAIYRNSDRPRGFSWTICIRTVLVIWFAAISLTIPWAMTFDVKVSDFDGLRYCVETWKNEKLGNIYFLVVNFIGFYAIPLLLIFVSNWIIYCHVMHRKVPDNSAASAPLRKMHRDTRRHVLKMLGIVTLTFLVSWLPVYILVVVIKFSDNISESEYNVLKILMPVAQWFGSWNSSMNPILYAFLNKKFRAMFKSILPSWIPVKAVEKYLGSSKTPSSTTAHTEKSLVRNKSNSKSDSIRHHPNGHINSQYQANLLVSTFKENSGEVAITAIQTISCALAAAPDFSSGTPGSIFSATIEEQTKSKIITDL